MSGSTMITCLYIFLHISMKVVCDNSGATIVHHDNNCADDAKVIHDAIEGMGTDEAAIINILGERTSQQRKLIAAAYGQPGKMAKDIAGDTSGDFKKILLQLTNSTEDLLATEINWSLHQKNDWSYIEILCTCDMDLLKRIKTAYFEAFGISLSQEIENKIQDVPTRLLLLRIIGGFELPPRSSEGFNDEKVNEQIKCIPEDKGKCRLEENGKLFTLLSKESFAQIRTVVKVYGEKHEDNPVVKRIKENCEDKSLKIAYTTIVSYAENPAKYFAQVLKDAMDGVGTKEKVLNRIIIWRSEIDLANVAQSFRELSRDKSLVDWVKGDTSGYYRKILLRLIKGNTNHEGQE